MVLHGISCIPHARSDPAQSLLCDVFSADLDPLPEVLDIGRRIEARHIARLPQDPFHHSTSASLAVGAGHMNETQALLRLSHKAQQFLRPGQPQFPLAPGMCVDIVNCLGNSHIPFPSLLHIHYDSIPARRHIRPPHCSRPREQQHPHPYRL